MQKDTQALVATIVTGFLLIMLAGYGLIQANTKANLKNLTELQQGWNGQTYTAGLEKGQQTQFQIDQEQCKTTLQQQLDAILKEVKTKGQIDLQGTILIEKI
jgi:hypothetical protein